MTTRFPTVTEKELVEFYLCGMRTSYPSLQEAKGNSTLVDSLVVKCQYCEDFHEIPSHSTRSELLDTARKEYNKLLDQLYNYDGNHYEQTPQLTTEAIVVRSYN